MLGRGGEGGEGELEPFEGLEDERLNGGRLIYLEVEAKSPALEMGVNGVVLALGEGLDERKLGDAGGLIHLFINILRQIIKSIKLKMDKRVRINSRVERANIASLWIYHRNASSSPARASWERSSGLLGSAY